MKRVTKQISRHLHSIETMQDIAKQAGLMDAIRCIQSIQRQRLLTTHDEIYQQIKFKAAVEFFIQQLNGANECQQRNHDIDKLIRKASKLLPHKMLQFLASTLHLNRLSFELDYNIAKQLLGKPINSETYVQAYVGCDNIALRHEQIELISALASDIAKLNTLKSWPSLLKMSKKPAALLGIIALHEFLTSSHIAFSQLDNVESFISPIINTELEIMQNLLNFHPSR